MSSPYEDDDAKPKDLPSGFKRIKEDNFEKVIALVKNIRNALIPATDVARNTGETTAGNSNTTDSATNTATDSGVISTAEEITNAADAANNTGEITPGNSNTTDAAGNTGETTTGNPNTADNGLKGKKRPIEMLVTDVEYIKKNIESLERSDNGKRADVLLHHLVEAAERRKVDDFTTVEVNLNKLLQIVAKLKLWVPPKRVDNSQGSAIDAKKEESPFISSKERENAATEIVKELVGLRCRQWGLDGLLNSYDELTDIVKNCLLCFSVFQCDVEKDKKTGVLTQKSLLIKKRILIHWWVAEGLVDLFSKENPDPVSELNPQNGSSPNPNSPSSNVTSNPDQNQPENPNPNPDPISNPNPNPHPIPNPNQVSPTQEGTKKKKKTIEKIGEDILKILVDKGFIEPVMKKAQESGIFQMHPFVHSFVTALAKRAGFFDFSDKDGKLTPSFGLSQRACLVKSQDKLSSCQQWTSYTDDRNRLKKFAEVQTLFNVNESIIDIKPEWFSKMKNLIVLHLGGWRSDPVEHIEVEDQKFMEDLKIMKQLRLFSLQGLSTVMKLPDSVCELTNLIILDLKECHNLEELPSGIGSLKNLTHLDITNCHLLTKLPKGISLLSNLEVFKGFVIYYQAGDDEVKKTCRWWRKTKGCLIHDVFRCKNIEVCTLKDLVKLKNLRELSLVVNIDNFPAEEDVQVFRNMRELYKLKISWEKSFKDSDDKKQGDNKASKRGCCFPCKKSASNEKPSTRGVETESQNAVAEQASSASDSLKQSPKMLSKTSTRGVETESQNAVAEQASSASDCLKLKCCKPQSKDAENPPEFLDQIKKLELWCFPKEEAPTWLHPSQLKNLEKLYIKGGNLKKLPGYTEKNKWTSIKTLRLKYLPDMFILWLELKTMFPNMTYLEKCVCEKLPFFPCDQEGVWQKTPNRLA